ncbi:acyl carrier protein [Pedobacter yonginense]|uniref:Acyl carrier protein n=1 Tax=Pedobacter yonginense TaxID=651869 RepID=A0A317ENT1_9SPHI|nr:phosphopantetheine-binding protein [Pedobacter yonginense]PWS26956.1 acyl carrier protein [Pedobacter yonginense]
MDKTEITQELATIITPYTEEKTALESLDENTDFIADLKINSANLVDIILDIEEKFSIVIDNDSMAQMLTVKDTVRIIQNKLNAG